MMQSSKKENDFQYPLLYIFQYTINTLTLIHSLIEDFDLF